MREMTVRSSRILFLFLFAGCSVKTPPAQQKGAAHDSLAAADFSAVASTQERSLTYEERQGRILYQRYCVVCHGDEGKGDGFNAFNLDPRPRDFSDSVYMNALGSTQTFETISGGGRSVNKSPLMPAYGWTMKKDEITYVVSYLRTFSSGRQERN